MFTRLSRYFSTRPYWIALLITALLLFWMLLAPTTSATNEDKTEESKEHLPKVETTLFTPKQMTKYLTLYGRSEANSRAVIRSEVAGKVANIVSEKGASVKAGAVLANIEKSELPERLAQAQALLEERLLNYKAVKALNAKGLQGRVRLAEVKSLLLAAKTDLKQLQLKLERTSIKASFSGVLQEQFAQQGDYLRVGDALFSLENIDPIVISGDTTEHYIEQLTLGQRVSATLLSGETISGKVSFIASLADTNSRTFRIEAEFPNPKKKMVSGMSAKLSIPLYPVDAIYISPSTLAMDEQGDLGVKSVDAGIVTFKAINLVEADDDGVWLSGFSEPVNIITRGQGFVKAGDSVQAIASEK